MMFEDQKHIRRRSIYFFERLLNLSREAVFILASALILIITSLFSFVSSYYWTAFAARAAQLNAISVNIYEFTKMLSTVESSQRGFLLTDRPEFLGGYNENNLKLQPILKAIRREVAAIDRAADGELASVEPLLSRKLKEMQQTIDLVSSGNKPAALARVADGYGKSLTSEIETHIHAVQASISKVFRSNEEDAKALQKAKSAADILALILVLGFSFISLASLLRSNRTLRQAQEKLASVNQELEVTVQRRTQALTHANEELQRFAYIVSHDLRSPLVNIMGFTSELAILRNEIFGLGANVDRPNPPEELKRQFDEALEFIRSSIGRMDRLINAILRVSREGSRPLTPDHLDIFALVSTIVSGMEHQIREKGAEVRIDAMPALVSDKLAIEQIFSNLIDNAVKYLRGEGGGLVQIAGSEGLTTNTYVVQDNGRGIGAKDHQRIFELFRRAGAQDVAGEGIGLANVAALVRRLGGTITVKSALNEGSIFTLTFPTVIQVKEGGDL